MPNIKLNDIKLIPNLESVYREKISDAIYFSDQYSDYISNSRLKLINPDQMGSPSKYQKGFTSETTQSLSIGSAVHELLLQPNDFTLVYNIDKPPAKLGQVIEQVYKNRMSNQTIYDSIVNACKQIHYYENSLTNSRISFIIREGLKYYFQLKQYIHDEGAILLSKRDRIIVEKCIDNLQRSSQVQSLLNPIDLFGDPIQSFNEDAFFINLDGSYLDQTCILKIKMKADNWSIDVDNKIITLNDLKTTGHLLSQFMQSDGSFFNFHYSRQFAMYLWILLRYCEKEYGYNKEEWKVKCNVIVSETTADNRCCVFSINSEYLEKGRKEFCKLLKMVAYCEMYGYSDDIIFE